jgi:hypothetical protein
MTFSRCPAQIVEVTWVMNRDYRRLDTSCDAVARRHPALGQEISIRINELCPLVEGKSHGAAAFVAGRKDIALACQGKMREPVALMSHKVYACAWCTVAHREFLFFLCLKLQIPPMKNTSAKAR